MWVKCVLVWYGQPLTSTFGLVNSSIKKMRLECCLHPTHSMTSTLTFYVMSSFLWSIWSHTKHRILRNYVKVEWVWQSIGQMKSPIIVTVCWYNAPGDIVTSDNAHIIYPKLLDCNMMLDVLNTIIQPIDDNNPTVTPHHNVKMSSS